MTQGPSDHPTEGGHSVGP